MLTSARENLSAWVRRSCLNLGRAKVWPGQGAMKAPTAQVAALPWGPPADSVPLLAHLLILVHHTLAIGVEHAEGAQDGFLGVRPWEPGWGEQVSTGAPGLSAPTQEAPGVQEACPIPGEERGCVPIEGPWGPERLGPPPLGVAWLGDRDLGLWSEADRGTGVTSAHGSRR